MNTARIMLLTSLALFSGCADTDCERLLDDKLSIAQQWVTRELREGMTLNEASTAIERAGEIQRNGSGCDGNLGISDSVCNEGRTIVGVLPIRDGVAMYRVYVFIHNKRGMLAYQISAGCKG